MLRHAQDLAPCDEREGVIDEDEGCEEANVDGECADMTPSAPSNDGDQERETRLFSHAKHRAGWIGSIHGDVPRLEDNRAADASKVRGRSAEAGVQISVDDRLHRLGISVQYELEERDVIL